MFLFKIYQKIFDLIQSKIYKNKKKIGKIERKKFLNLSEVFFNHFIEDHPCRDSMFDTLKIFNQKEINIIETGSSAWGMNSTSLFDSYVNSFGGNVYSVDIRAKPMLDLEKKLTKNTQLFCMDSVKFLEKIELNNKNQTLFYLDSMDVNWRNPLAAMKHGLNEFKTLTHILKVNDHILIDDTPLNEKELEIVQGKKIANIFKFLKNQKNIIGGKGSLILHYIQKSKKINYQIINHKYQLLIKVKNIH
tara:strand:- start:3040 stop:3780 length:741 start_codon:yes stop_codon:yes gene_type:complete